MINDFYLKTDDEASMREVLVDLVLPATINIGEVICNQSPNWSLMWIGALVTVEGEVLPGFHANLRWIGDGFPTFSDVIIHPAPSQPLYVWAE